MKPLLVAALFAALVGSADAASVNAGDHKAEASRPFVVSEIASFDRPWAIAFLPDGNLLVTEKPGRMFLTKPDGTKSEIGDVPEVSVGGQNGLLDIAVSPRFATDSMVYFTFVEPGPGGSSLALARARLTSDAARSSLDGVTVIWRQEPKGSGGQPGGIIAFDPEGNHLLLTSGDRMRPKSAQDPDQALGKVLRLNLDGSVPSDNPHATEGGVRAETWTMGHRNPYGLAFAPDGTLWLHEMGPRGGDELNRIEPSRNYGWPIVSNGDNYSGTPIPRHATRPEFEAPAVYWNPVIAPAGLAFYEGPMFPQWRGSALIGALVARGIVRITFDDQGGAVEADRWSLGARIRDVAIGPDGAVWAIEDDSPGRLLRLTPGASSGRI